MAFPSLNWQTKLGLTAESFAASSVHLLRNTVSVKVLDFCYFSPERTSSLILIAVVRPDVFTNNRLSLTLVDPPTADVLLLMTGIIYNGAGALSDALKDPQFGPSYEPAKSPFMYHLKNKGIDGDFFKYLEVNVSLQQ